MPDKHNMRTYVSSLRIHGEGEKETNDKCHNFTGGVESNNKHVMRNPKVVLVLWDHYYRTNPDAISYAQQLITDLIAGPFMNGLAQYGIARGRLINTIAIDTIDVPAPDSWDVNNSNDEDQIKSWIKSGLLSPSPARDETNLLYFLLLPSTTQLTNGKKDDGTPNPDVCGWHKHSKAIESQSNDDDVFWGLVRTDRADRTTEKAFINSIAFCISHELNEAFSDRDGHGFTASNGCEIGDICETKEFYDYRGWSGSIEQYWSQWNNTCIRGSDPVSLRRFLFAIKFDTHEGLRSLQTPVINTDFIASKM